MPLLTAFPSVDSVFEWAAEAREGAWRDWWKDEVGSPSCSKGGLKEWWSGQLVLKEGGTRVIKRKGRNIGRKLKRCCVKSDARTVGNILFEWGILMALERLTDISLVYEDLTHSGLWLAAQSHLSLLLVGRCVCCLSLGRQQQSIRLDSQSDGIIQPSIKICGQR